MHVVMMLAGLARNDTRVLREAAWLARAGLDVTILARSVSGRVSTPHITCFLDTASNEGTARAGLPAKRMRITR